jgi:hypothetical protein
MKLLTLFFLVLSIAAIPGDSVTDKNTKLSPEDHEALQNALNAAAEGINKSFAGLNGKSSGRAAPKDD